MPSLAWLRRLAGSARTSAFERAMADEIAHHIDLETAALVARGLTPDAAGSEARRRFGSVAHIEDACREAWGFRILDVVRQDLRLALRTLASRRAYSLAVALTLGLGIGANTAIFSVVHAVLVRPLPYAHGDALVEITQQATSAGI